MKIERSEVTRGGGKVYRDLGHANADIMQFKARASHGLLRSAATPLGGNAMDDTGKAFGDLLGRMTQAICRGDAEGASACFTPQGVYHDGFYGEFRGRAEIDRMLRGFFYRDAEKFEWTLHGAVSDGTAGYAQYDFSYVSRLEGSAGTRVGFSGVSICRLEGGLIAHYGECFERAPVLAKLGFPDARILKSVQRWAKASA